jgi:hypothetical protein
MKRTGGEVLEENICAREGCENAFERKTHNQKFCTDECTRLATNERIMKNYYKDKDRKDGKKRYCNKCNALLSKYNPTEICSPCSIKKKNQSDSSAIAMILNSTIIL